MTSLTWLFALAGAVMLSGCRRGADRQSAQTLPAATSYTQLWQHPFELGPAARRAVAVASPCAIWLVAGSVSQWTCAGDSLQTLPYGEGPGEVRYPWLVSTWANDSVAVWDAHLTRLSIFDTSGAFARSTPLPIVLNNGMRVAGIFHHDGELHLWINPFPVPFADSAPGLRGHVWAVTGGAQQLGDSLISFNGPLSTVMREGDTYSRVDAPVRRKPFVVVLDDGRTLVTSSGSDTVLVYAWDGTLRDTVTLGLPAEAITDEDHTKYADSIRESFESELAGQQYPEDLKQLFRKRAGEIAAAGKWPPTRQRMDLMVAGSDDTFWILRPAFGESYDREWRVYGLDGTVRKVLHVPHWGSVAAAAVSGDTITTVEFRWGADSTALARYALSAER
jgi:hypothetical protein